MTRAPRILVDLDGVLADFDRAFNDYWTASFPDRALGDPTTREVAKISDAMPVAWRADARRIISSAGFYRSLPPIEGAVEGFRELVGAYPDVWICSTPLRDWNPCVPEKFAWVEEHLGAPWTERLILVRDKTLVDATLLIDDLPELAHRSGATWQLVLHDRAYNRHAVGVSRMTWATWRDVVPRLLPDRQATPARRAQLG
jgi:5'-nucleotidase